MTSRKLEKCKYSEGKIEKAYSYCVEVGGMVNRKTCKECKLFEPKEAKK